MNKVIEIINTAKWKVVNLWNSGPKGKIVILGIVGVFLLIGALTEDDETEVRGISEQIEPVDEVECIEQRPSASTQLPRPNPIRSTIVEQKHIPAAKSKPYVPPERIYQCDQCHDLVKLSHQPSGAKCSGRKNAPHRWTSLGEFGDNVYQCRKCSIKIKVKYSPSGGKCPAERNGPHSWSKL